MDYLKQIKKRKLPILLTIPFILSLIIPMLIFDVWVEIYHRICFLLYGLKYVKRTNYIKIDRHKLKHLNWYQKIACAYCGYANGLANYWVTIAGETEKYWCGIMHKKIAGFKAPEHHKNFVKYGSKKEFSKRYKKRI